MVLQATLQAALQGACKRIARRLQGAYKGFARELQRDARGLQGALQRALEAFEALVSLVWPKFSNMRYLHGTRHFHGH